MGTLGARYLAGRAIQLPDAAPSAIRWHPASGSLVFASTRDNGAVQAVQRVYVGQDARKLEKPELDRRRLPAAKVTTGPADGAAVRLPGPTTGPILLAEGPETGLSVWQATGHETWVALGQLAKLAPPLGRVVILCRDDDKPKKAGQPGPSADDRHRKRVAELRGQGLQVATAMPWPDRRQDGSDFNDVLRACGNEAVASRIAAVTPPDLPPEFTPPTHTLDQARATLVPKVAEFYRGAVKANVRDRGCRGRQVGRPRRSQGVGRRGRPGRTDRFSAPAEDGPCRHARGSPSTRPPSWVEGRPRHRKDARDSRGDRHLSGRGSSGRHRARRALDGPDT